MLIEGDCFDFGRRRREFGVLLKHVQGKIHGFSAAAGAKILLIALFLRSQDLVTRIRGGDRREGGTGRVKYPD